jgi:hypothetical protein
MANTYDGTDTPITEMIVANESHIVSCFNAARSPSRSPTTAPINTAYPPILMEIGSLVFINWEIGVFFEIL